MWLAHSHSPVTPSLLQGFGKPVAVEADSDKVTLYLDGGVLDAPLMTCPATEERYFFASLPCRSSERR